MYPAAEIEDLDEQIRIIDLTAKYLNLLSHSRSARTKVWASTKQLELEKELASLKLARNSREQLALVAEPAGMPNGADGR